MTSQHYTHKHPHTHTCVNALLCTDLTGRILLYSDTWFKTEKLHLMRMNEDVRLTKKYTV